MKSWHIVKEADAFVIQRIKRTGDVVIHSRYKNLKDAEFVLFAMRLGG